MKKEKSCGVIIFCDDEYLIIKHSSVGHWDFPKGHVEEGETELQTAQREVFEETGLKAKLIDGFKEETNYYTRPGVFKTVVWFLGFVVNKKVKCQEGEISDHKWLKFEDALKQLTFANAKEILKKANAFLQNR